MGSPEEESSGSEHEDEEEVTSPAGGGGSAHESSPAPSGMMMTQDDTLPVSLRHIHTSGKGAYPNYQQLADATQTLTPFNVVQLGDLQGELAEIGKAANVALTQLERERNELERWLKQFRNYNAFGPDFVDPDDAMEHTTSSPSARIEERSGSSRIRTATP